MEKRIFIMGLIVFISLSIAHTGHAFRENVVSAWTFEEGSGKAVKDISGNGNNGEIIGGAQWTDGKIGKALDFDGSTGYVLIPFGNSMELINKRDFTFAAWFRPDAVPSENKEVFQQGDKNGTGRTWLYLAANTGEIQTYLGNAATLSGVQIEPEKWYHTAMVITEAGGTDTIQFYINGEPAGTPSQKGLEDSQGDFFIGCHKNITNFWAGIIDEVALINKALNQAEIKTLMSGGIQGVLSIEPMGKLALTWGKAKLK